MPDRENFIDLLNKYTSDTISPEERNELFACIASGMYDEIVLQHIQNKLQATAPEGENSLSHRSEEILSRIVSSEKQNSLLIRKTSLKGKIMRWAVAAAVTGAIAFSAYFFNDAGNKDSISNTAITSATSKTINTSGRPLKIELKEGSVVTLQPGSAIYYSTDFLPDKREVFLEGEAFFEVSKNAHRPFFVYHKNIVTHVLGTSFNIGINKNTQQVEVTVRSGRVEVYEKESRGKTPVGKAVNRVILLPNQKVIYEQDTRHFVQSLADVPLPIANESGNTKSAVESFVFEESPLKTVLESLEKSYGIEIKVEREGIYKCLFTGDISVQDLYTRLDIICQSVQASYKVEGTKILISGRGCE